MSTDTTDKALSESDNFDQSKLESSPCANDADSNLQRSLSVLSVSSVASSASGIPVKKSAIKPPSRIGRPCAGQQHKPAVPTSPVLNSSTVLTEDTDSFKIGQRVWVGGTKPGSIAFIGETQFAPGDWAGIALDEPIGKNDGSVAGITYFQCAPKKGVFSRLTRLTRVPLEETMTHSFDSFSSPPPYENKGPLSPTGSTRSLLKSPVSHYASNTSLASTSTSYIIDYKIGDRVIIKSSQGSKVGTVRYMGYTDFAPGEWVGVELDDPRGKNDGSVEGKRYFTCQPNFGLFAPVNKVSKSPSKVKPGACAVHNSSLPPSGMRKSTSKESMMSAASSVRRVRLGVNSLTPKKVPSKISPVSSRPSLQDIIKDKQQQIDQLLRERDLDRQEFTKAASQAEEAEQQLLLIKNEFDAYRSECEIKLQEHIALLTELKKDRTDLLGQLEDEKKKNEDLLFKFEEAAIIKGDLEVLLDSKSTDIKELNMALESGLSRLNEMDKNSEKLFESEKGLIKANEEIDQLKAQLEMLTLENKSFTADISLSNDQLESLKKELEITKKQLEELNNTRNDLSQQLTALNIEHAQVQQQQAALQKKLEFSENQFTQKELESIILKSELDSTKQSMTGYHIELEEFKRSQRQQDNELNNEIEKLKMELSARCFDVETANNELKFKTETIQVLTEQYNEMEQKISDAKVEHNQEINNLTEKLNGFKEMIKSKNDEIASLKESSEQYDLSLNTCLEENEKKICEYQKEHEILKNEVETLKQSVATFSCRLRERQENSAQIEKLQNLLKSRNEEFNLLLCENTSVRNELLNKSEILEKTLDDNENLKISLNGLNDELRKSKDDKQKMELDNGDLRRNNETLKQNLKDTDIQIKQMNEHLQSLLNSTGDNSVKLEEMHATLSEKQTLLDKTKQEFQQKVQIIEHDLEEKILQLKEKDDNISRLSKEIIDMKDSLSLIKEENKEKIKTLFDEIAKSTQSHEVELAKMQNALVEKDKIIEKIRFEMQQQVETSNSFVDEKIRSFNAKIIELTEEKHQLHEDLATNIRENALLRDEIISKTELKEEFDRLCKEHEQKMEEFCSMKEHMLRRCVEFEETQRENEGLQALIVTKNDALESAINKMELEISQRNNDNKKLQEDLQKKNVELEQLNTKFREYVEHNESTVSEKMQDYSKQIVHLETKLVESISNLSESNTQKGNLEIQLQNESSIVEAKKIEIDDLLKKLKMYEETSKALEMQSSNFQDAFKNFNNQTIQANEMIEKLKSEVDSLDQKCKLFEIELKEEKLKYDSLLKNGVETDEIMRNKVENLVNKLQTAEKHTNDITSERDLILQCIQELQFSQSQKHDLLHKVSQLGDNNFVEIFRNLNENYKDELLLNQITDLEQSVENLRTDLNKEKELYRKQKTETDYLKNQLKHVQDASNKLDNNDIDDTKNSSILVNNKKYDYQKLLEDKLLAENQVEFLNSIIVDMKKKNEDQQVKIELLESGYSPAAAKELQSLDFSLGNKKVAPRMFCDICDRFDEHETEDCPQQMSEDMPAPPIPPEKKKKKPAPRPYCELCEAFGHDTQDCQEDDTF